MYRKYRTIENIASSVSQYESYCDHVYRYTPNPWYELRVTTGNSTSWPQGDMVVILKV